MLQVIWSAKPVRFLRERIEQNSGRRQYLLVKAAEVTSPKAKKFENVVDFNLEEKAENVIDENREEETEP